MRTEILMQKALYIWDGPSRIVEIMAEEKGHKVLYLPQYHSEYNAI